MRSFAVFSLACLMVVPVVAQVTSRRAAMRGNRGGPGKCTIEVVVDGVAEVEITGDTARLKTLSGTPSEFRRFECNDVMPFSPADFRFTGVDGRGRQTLVRDPRNSRGMAVIRIEDPQGGREGYTFDIEWRGGGGGGDRPYGGERERDRDRDRQPPPPPERGWRGGAAFPVERAIRVCEEGVRDEALRTHHLRDITITRSRVDDGPGRNDWIIGDIESRRGEHFRFACSVDLRSGRVRSVEVTHR